MATGVAINGAVQGLGLGLNGVWSSGQIPSQWAGAVSRGGGKYDGDTALRSLCRGELIPSTGRPLFAPSNTCGIEGSMACNYGGPQSSLSGLNGFLSPANIGCSSLNAEVMELEHLLKTSGALLSEASRTSAQLILSEFNGADVYLPFVGNQCERDTGEVRAAVDSLRAELGTAAPAPLRPNRPGAGGGGTDSPSLDTVGTIVKWGAIGLVAIAGAYALGPILRGAAGLIPSRRKG